MSGGLGRQQRKILESMRRFGNGVWQPNWHTTDQMRRCFGTLVERGLIEPVKLRYGTLEFDTYKLVPPGTTTK